MTYPENKLPFLYIFLKCNSYCIFFIIAYKLLFNNCLLNYIFSIIFYIIAKGYCVFLSAYEKRYLQTANVYKGVHLWYKSTPEFFSKLKTSPQ